MNVVRSYDYPDAELAVRGSSTARDAKKQTAPYLERVRRIEKALVHDQWLPMGLRTLLASELPWIRKKIAKGTRGWRASVAGRIHELAMVSFRYGFEVLDSEAIAQLRVLDLELNPVRLTRESIDDWDKGSVRLAAMSSMRR